MSFCFLLILLCGTTYFTSSAMDSKDFEVTSPPTDGISALSFSSQANFLAASSWDEQVRIYEVQSSGNTIPRTAYSHQGPVLSVAWSKDGTKVVSGGGDAVGRMFDVTTGQFTQIASHEAPIKSIQFLDQTPHVVATGSWDKTLQYWDLRSPSSIGKLSLPDRCYSMDIQGSLLVAGCAEKHVMIVDLTAPTTPFKQATSPLKWQTRTVSCFTQGRGYAVGSIEGRVAIQYIEEKEQSKNFSFKCHRDEQKNVFSVNAISFHPGHGTFSTAGADGTVSFWDKDSKQRLKLFPNLHGTIPCTAFNHNGTLFAYAMSYDWSKGHRFALPTYPNKILLHAVKEDDVKPRATKKR
ncbi:WD40-repeat-containing domain protein [Spinellus fusiger]|nr:WD40-repeat-containing domain protein [Spinellus fusiger]